MLNRRNGDPSQDKTEKRALLTFPRTTAREKTLFVITARKPDSHRPAF